MDAQLRRALDDQQIRFLRVGYLFTAAWNSLYVAIMIVYAAATWRLTARAMLGVWGGYVTEGDAQVLRWIFAVSAIGMAVAATGLVILKLLTARALKRRRNRWLCLATAAISCLNLPYGTALGVATLMVLSRESVVALFDGSPDTRSDNA